MISLVNCKLHIGMLNLLNSCFRTSWSFIYLLLVYTFVLFLLFKKNGSEFIGFWSSYPVSQSCWFPILALALQSSRKLQIYEHTILFPISLSPIINSTGTQTVKQRLLHTMTLKFSLENYKLLLAHRWIKM